MSAGRDPKYWAFISYSHADAKWAEWLHKSLERYRIPARLVGRETPAGIVPKKMFPVFRDRDELAGSSELGGALEQALAASRCQVVIASPNSARSRWVGEEIKYFKSLGRSSRVLALIVDGEPGATEKGSPEREAFHEALRFKVDEAGTITSTPAEQVAADARKHADGKDNALLKLIAGILGVGFDELRQRELQARNRRLVIAASMASAVAAVTVVLAVLAMQARNDALRRQQQAEDLLQFMVGDLRDKLEPIGKLAILDAVGKKAMDYFATLEKNDLTDAALASRAKALRQIGDVRTKQGDMAGASEAVEQALALDQELVQRHPDDTESLANVADSEFAMGYAHYVKGEFEKARPWWERSGKTADRLLALQPGEDRWVAKVSEAHANMGALLYQLQNMGDARKEYEIGLDRLQPLLSRKPDDSPLLVLASDIRSGLWGIALATTDTESALTQAQECGKLRRHLSSLQPDNAGYKNSLAAANLVELYTESLIRPVMADAPALRETLALTEELAKLDPDNIEYLRNRQIALNYLIDAHLSGEHVNAAEQASQQLLSLARDTYRRAPANAAVLDDLLGIMNQSAKLALLQKDRATALARIREVQALPLTPAQVKASTPSRWLDLALTDWLIAARTPDASKAQAFVEQWLAKAKASGTVKPELMLRYEALSGNMAAASQYLGKLSALERSHPFVKQFCRETRACGDSPPA